MSLPLFQSPGKRAISRQRPSPRLAGAMRDEPLDWGGLVPLVVHPVKVAIIEAMQWIDEPLSAMDVHRMHDHSPGTSAVAYHLKSLAFDLPVLRLYDEEAIRGHSAGSTSSASGRPRRGEGSGLRRSTPRTCAAKPSLAVSRSQSARCGTRRDRGTELSYADQASPEAAPPYRCSDRASLSEL